MVATDSLKLTVTMLRLVLTNKGVTTTVTVGATLSTVNVAKLLVRIRELPNKSVIPEIFMVPEPL